MKGKADRFELENINMLKCNKHDLNALADKFAVLQQEITRELPVSAEHAHLGRCAATVQPSLQGAEDLEPVADRSDANLLEHSSSYFCGNFCSATTRYR